MEKVTAIHKAIQVIDNMMRDLKLQRAELVGVLPKKKRKITPMFFPDPYTGEEIMVENKRG